LTAIGALTAWTGVGAWAMAAGIGMMAAGTAATIAGGYQQSAEMKAQAKDARQQAENAEKMAEYENIRAQQAFKRGEAEARKRSLLLAQQQGVNKASAAGAGLLVDDNAGATLDDVYMSNALNAESDIQIINENANLQVMAHAESRQRMIQEAMTLENTARAYRRGASKAIKMGYIQAGVNLALSNLGGYFASEAVAAGAEAAVEAAEAGAGSFTSIFGGIGSEVASLQSDALLYGTLSTGTLSLVGGGGVGNLAGGVINVKTQQAKQQKPYVEDYGADYGGKTMGTDFANYDQRKFARLGVFTYA
jgi:hypothetical protein